MKRIFLLILPFLLFPVSTPVYADAETDLLSFLSGLEAYEKGNYKTAFNEFKPFAEQGEVNAQWFLGVMYHEGQGVIQDYKKSAKWYRLAAEQGLADAQNNLGVMYNEGQGVFQDYKK